MAALTTTIESLLASRGADLLPASAALRELQARAELSKRIAAAYPLFEGLRDLVLDRRVIELSAAHRPVLATMEETDLVRRAGGKWQPSSNEARRYLTGGWLEEYVALAVAEIGADEVMSSQKIAWQSGTFRGENEIDVLARFGERLFFCSCKALRSTLAPNDVRTRGHLMDALHEADNLADHFAPDRAIVSLAVTTDLFDERFRSVRYEQLHGKASALGVHLLSGESLHWPVLLKTLRKIITTVEG